MQINKHKSFYIRDGWPTKIVDAVVNEPFIFSPSNELKAVDMIGVGRVMVESMRYWAIALGISVESKAASGICHRLTEIGDMIRAYDPYCQRVGTLWLLHRNLATNADIATAWYWAFNEMNAKSFKKETFVSGFSSYIQRIGDKAAKSIIEKEFDCFKNTYVSDKNYNLDRIVDEDTVPFFAPLNLIEYTGSGCFDFKTSNAVDIPAEIAFYSVLMDNRSHFLANKQIEIDTLLNGENQIGRYMNLSYSSLLGLLQRLDNIGYITLVNNFGNRFIQIEKDPERLPHDLLTNYYSK